MKRILVFIFACALTMFLYTPAYAEDVWAYRTQEYGNEADVYVQSETCNKVLEHDHWVYSAKIKYVRGGRLISRCSVEFAKMGYNVYDYRIIREKSNGRWQRIHINDPFMNTLKVIKQYTGE